MTGEAAGISAIVSPIDGKIGRAFLTPGNYVDVTADMDVLFVISNCPQVNNPCNGFNPTPIRVVIRDAPGL